MLLEGCLNCYRKVSYIITPCYLVTSNFGLPILLWMIVTLTTLEKLKEKINIAIMVA